MRNIIIPALFLMLVISCSSQAPEEKSVSEPEITELQKMHHFIRPMWHDAYPAKDMGQLKELYPKILGQYQLLKDAAFPEQWQDKKLHWNEGISQMGKTLDEYKLAMDNNDDENLLQAARKLHDDFENLMMIVNPPIPELDDFHKTLYYVYHDYMPEKNWEMLKASIPEFEKKAQALQEAEVPRWMEENKDTYQEAINQLQAAVKNLSRLKDSDDEALLEKAVEEIHDAYVKLEGCMD
ncbi:MAG: hypothetical protein JSW33_06800 [bacterium]|nr:MAG: hypothetical protein JSW33_06800 [bacterium]